MANVEINTFTQAVSATLARRLADASAGYVSATGYQGSKTIYFVASYVPQIDPLEGQLDYVIYSAFPTQEEASAAITDLELDPDIYAVFGPFSAIPDMFDLPVPGLGQTAVSEVAVTLPGPGTPQPSIAFPAQYDALFFSQPAVEKFLVPYYAGVSGPGFVQTLLAEFASSDLALLGHLPWSEYQSIELSGSGGGTTGGTSNARNRVATDVVHLFNFDEKGNLTHRELHPPVKPA